MLRRSSAGADGESNSLPWDRDIATVRGQRVILGCRSRAHLRRRHANAQSGRQTQCESFSAGLRVSTGHGRKRSRSHVQDHTQILKRGANIKHLPLAFTEHGAIMAASILKAPRAVEMSIFVVARCSRACVRSPQNHAELAAKIDAIERRVEGHDEDLEEMFDALRALLAPGVEACRQIGFGRPPIKRSPQAAIR